MSDIAGVINNYFSVIPTDKNRFKIWKIQAIVFKYYKRNLKFSNKILSILEKIFFYK